MLGYVVLDQLALTLNPVLFSLVTGVFGVQPVRHAAGASTVALIGELGGLHCAAFNPPLAKKCGFFIVKGFTPRNVRCQQ